MSNPAKIIMVLVALLLAFVGFNYLKGDEESSPTTGLVRENFDSSVGGGDNSEFLRVLKNLESVSLDGSFLATEAFTNLIDFSLELTPEPVGRPNPFRPINLLERDLATFQNASSTGTSQ